MQIQNTLAGQMVDSQLASPELLKVATHHIDQSQQISTDRLQNLPKTEKEAFEQFVGETFYSIMVKQMRAGTGKVDLFGKSTATRTFQQQFDTQIVQSLAENNSSGLSTAMYDLHKLGRAN